MNDSYTSIYLPNMESLNIAALSQLFDKRTTSYKMLFFWACIELLRKRNATNDGWILDTKDIVIEMLALAWFPHTFFRLSFGLNDQVGTLLDSIQFDVEERRAGLAVTQQRLRRSIAKQYKDAGAVQLLRYVQFRILQPFFAKELRGKRDQDKNKLIEDLANQSLNSRSPAPYGFCENGKKIVFHHTWGEYFTSNYPVIIGWIQHHWVNYLQRKNPNTPAIPLKIQAPLKRTPLTKQRNYWERIIGHTDIRCIYTNEIIRQDSFDLDHFLPWSFVCHDQSWNLIPVVPEANSSKGNSLPSLQYIKLFVETQHIGLTESFSLFSNQKWQNAVESYIGDLHLSGTEMLSIDKLAPAYSRILNPMIDLASQSGFSTGWKYGV